MRRSGEPIVTDYATTAAKEALPAEGSLRASGGLHSFSCLRLPSACPGGQIAGPRSVSGDNTPSVTLVLEASDAELRFSVRDDGRGFDVSSTGYGTGLQGIADRLAALNGSVQIESSPGAGTTIVGALPLP